ncbi:MAG: hypothetical protein ACI358_07010 [Candidatus Limimorpha sp.]
MNIITISSQNINNCKLPYVEKRINTLAIFLGTLLLIIGVLMFYLSSVSESSMMSSTDVFAGIVSVVIAVCLIFFQRKKLVEKETGSIIKKECVYYNVNDLDAILSALKRQDYFIFSNIHRQENGNVQMLFYYSKDHRYFAAQVLRYEPFEYRPVSDIFIFRDMIAERFVEKIR